MDEEECERERDSPERGDDDNPEFSTCAENDELAKDTLLCVPNDRVRTVPVSGGLFERCGDAFGSNSGLRGMTRTMVRRLVICLSSSLFFVRASGCVRA